MKLQNSRPITIDLGPIKLLGNLYESKESKQIVIFVHGSGSSRLSPRNIMVAEYLASNGISSFLFDLLTEEEDKIYENRFNIELLTKRLVDVTRWLKTKSITSSSKYGYFGASTGAAAALKASITFKEIKAIVSRGGRPDLALPDLHLVTAPTLLLVGGLDGEIIELNILALNKLKGIKELSIVDGATHLFEEPGKLETVSNQALSWFQRYLVE